MGGPWTLKGPELVFLKIIWKKGKGSFIPDCALLRQVPGEMKLRAR